MSGEGVASEQAAVLRLHVIAEPDSRVLARVLERVQNCNVVAQRVLAECVSVDEYHIQIDTIGLTERNLTLIAARIEQMPCVFRSWWHRV